MPSTSIRGAGTAPETSSSSSHLIGFSTSFLASRNLAFIKSSTFLHHEVAHIALTHEIGNDYKRKISPEYFNHPVEIDAYLHQGLAELARKAGYQSWAQVNSPDILGDDQEKFTERLKNILRPQFWKALYPVNKNIVTQRAAAFWNAGQQALNPEMIKRSKVALLRPLINPQL